MNILLIDDDQFVYHLIRPYIENGDTLNFLESFTNVERAISEYRVDVAVIDISLENDDGLRFYSQHKELFAGAGVSVVFLSSSHVLENKLRAFQLGAVDYVQKPFEPLELLARLRLICKKVVNSNKFIKNDLVFEVGSRTLLLNQDNKSEEVELTSKEFKILLYLAKREKEVVTRDDILNNAWDRGTSVVDRSVDQHICRIRRKISSSSYTINTTYGAGYTFCLKRSA